MNEKFGSLGAHEFFWEVLLKILYLSVKFLALSNDCKDSLFLTINAIYSSNVYMLREGFLRAGELKNNEK